MFCDEHGTLDYCPECIKEYTESKEITKLKARLEAYKAHIADLRDHVRAGLECDDGTTNYLDETVAVLKNTPAQSLGDIKAKAVMGLIEAHSHSQSINGIAWMVIGQDDAFNYADKLKEGKQ